MSEVVEDVLDDELDDPVDLEQLVTSFHKDVEATAKFYINVFFEGKEMYGGGPIPACNLHAPAYLELVLNTDVCRGVELAYSVLEADEATGEDEDRNPKEVQLVLDIFRQCETLLIPKEFAPGLMLMCLEICHGIRPDVGVESE